MYAAPPALALLTVTSYLLTVTDSCLKVPYHVRSHHAHGCEHVCSPGKGGPDALEAARGVGC